MNDVYDSLADRLCELNVPKDGWTAQCLRDAVQNEKILAARRTTNGMIVAVTVLEPKAPVSCLIHFLEIES